MSGYARHDLPADIDVFHGTFASQQLVFAHLLDEAPDLNLDHVEVIQTNHAARLSAYFDLALSADLARHGQTLVLILPAAHDAPGPLALGPTAHLRPLGSHRGTVPHLRAVP